MRTRARLWTHLLSWEERDFFLPSPRALLARSGGARMFATAVDGVLVGWETIKTVY